MKPQDYSKELQDLYHAACNANLCNSYGTFAELINTSQSQLSQAINGTRFVSTKWFNAAKQTINDALKNAGISQDISNSAIASGKSQSTNGIPAAEHVGAINKLIDEMSAQRQTYERIILAALNSKIDK